MTRLEIGRTHFYAVYMHNINANSKADCKKSQKRYINTIYKMNSFYEIIITLILKQRKAITIKVKHTPIFPINVGAKILN